ARIRATLCEGPEERRAGCRGDCGGSDAADDAVCRAQERGATGSTVAASRARAFSGGADGLDQPAARPAAGAWHHRTARAAQARAIAARDPGGRTQWSWAAGTAADRGHAFGVAGPRRADHGLR